MNTVEPMYKWSDISWRKLEKNIYKLQKLIYKASRRGDVKLVRRLQKLLIKSWNAKCFAVRRVTEENQRNKTAGEDVNFVDLMCRVASYIQNYKFIFNT